MSMVEEVIISIPSSWKLAAKKRLASNNINKKLILNSKAKPLIGKCNLDSSIVANGQSMSPQLQPKDKRKLMDSIVENYKNY